jgi:glutamine amidotransferase
MITVVNYGLGNVQAFVNIYKRLNAPVRVATSAGDLADAERIILPGVGTFDWAMTRLNESGMRDTLEARKNAGARVLGICVGMQILARRSDEGRLAGLGWIDGEVKRFDASRITAHTHLPHMGWNDVAPRQSDGLFRNLDDQARFYFLHSYYFEPRHPEHVLADTDYHGRYASSVGSDNVLGVQFHPEKSHRWGIQLLKNFAEM